MALQFAGEPMLHQPRGAITACLFVAARGAQRKRRIATPVEEHHALLAAGKPHEVLPLVGVTHMTPQEVVAENLLLHQLEFLRRSLGMQPAQ